MEGRCREAASPAMAYMVVQEATSGTTSLRVTNIGGNGAPTVEGIKIIDVAGASNGAFSLQGDYVILGVSFLEVVHSEQAEDDVAPSFYPVLRSFLAVVEPFGAGEATSSGAVLLAWRGARGQRGMQVEAKTIGACHPSCE